VPEPVATFTRPSPPPVDRPAETAQDSPSRLRAAAEEMLDLKLAAKTSAASVHRQAHVARWCLLTIPPLVVVSRVWSDGGWLQEAVGSWTGALAMVAAGLLTAAGSVWLVLVTRSPYPLWPHRRNHVVGSDEADRLLLVNAQRSALRHASTDSPVEASRAIQEVASLRQAQLRRLAEDEDRIAVVTILPFVICLLPAVVLLLLA